MGRRPGALGGLTFELQEYTEEGEGAVTKLRVRGEHEGTGIEQTMYQGVVFDGRKARWWQTFRSDEEAWTAVRARLGERPLGA